MRNPLILACVGSSDPLIREYVHDFGLCAISLTILEEALRHHLVHRAMLRAEWRREENRLQIRGRKYLKIADKYDRLTLGGLVGDLRHAGGDSAILGLLDPLVEERNTLLHNHLGVSENGQFTTARLQALRSILHSLAERADVAGHAVQVADTEVFEKVIEKMRAAGASIDSLGPPLPMVLESLRSLLRRTERA